MFDHRNSIHTYADKYADQIEAQGRTEAATLIRALSSNIKAQLDIVAGEGEIASPVHAIIVETVKAFGVSSFDDVVRPKTLGDRETVRVRVAAMWVAKQRTGWDSERIAVDFNRSGETVRRALKDAEERREKSTDFRRLTDALVERTLRCENCQHALT